MNLNTEQTNVLLRRTRTRTRTRMSSPQSNALSSWSRRAAIGTTLLMIVVGRYVWTNYWSSSSTTSEKDRKRGIVDDDEEEEEEEDGTQKNNTTSTSITGSDPILPPLPLSKEFKGSIAILLPSAPSQQFLKALNPILTKKSNKIYLIYPTQQPDEQSTQSTTSSSNIQPPPLLLFLLPYSIKSAPIHMLKALNPGLILLSSSSSSSLPSSLLLENQQPKSNSSPSKPNPKPIQYPSNRIELLNLNELKNGLIMSNSNPTILQFPTSTTTSNNEEQVEKNLLEYLQL